VYKKPVEIQIKMVERNLQKAQIRHAYVCGRHLAYSKWHLL